MPEPRRGIQPQSKPTPTVVLSTAPSPAIFGKSVSVTATVTPSSATGKVAFLDGSGILGLGTLTGGTTTVKSSLLSAGSHTLNARYYGDGTYAPAHAAAIWETILPLPQAGFGALQTGAAGFGPESVVATDFNGDGITDLAVANYADVSVSVLLGNGDGTFQPPISSLAGNNPSAIGATDLDGDGTMDLVAACAGDNTVAVLLGNGDGTFRAPVTFPTGTTPSSVAIMDLNGDGLADLAIANFVDNTLSVFIGDGTGSFTPSQTYATGSGPLFVAFGDFNGDGKVDLAVADSDPSANQVSIYLGHGDGTLGPAVQYATGLGPSWIVAGDFNGDVFTDLATADFGDFYSQQGGDVGVLLGNGNGVFQPAVSYAVGQSPESITLADVNGDGVLDLVVAASQTVMVLAGSTNGVFQPAVSYAAGTSGASIVAGDFNGDGVADVAVAEYNDSEVGVLLGVPGSCSATISPNMLTLDGSAQTVTLQITTNSPSCSWSPSANSAWITAGGTVLGNGALQVQLAANNSGAARTAVVTILNQTVSFTQDETVQQFSDVLPTAYYFDAVNLLKGKDVTSGCGPTLYCPLNNVTRSQMAVFIIRGIYGGDDFSFSSTPHFSDVPTGAFGFQWIQKMFELGITSGCTATTYCPNDPVTRAQMAVFIIRGRLGASATFTYPAVPYFTDVGSNGFGFKWIQRMREEGITSGCSATLYCPSNSVTRGDMAIFVMRGLFNQLLPAGAAVISSISPSTIAAGTSATISISGVNTSFSQATTQLNPMPGIAIGVLTVVNPTSLTVTLTASSTPSAQPPCILVSTGDEEAVLPNALTIQ